MNITLTDGDDPVQLDLDEYSDLGGKGQLVLLQNLGAGDVYFDRADDVDATSGVKIATDGQYKLSSVSDMYFMADGGDADLRYTVIG